MDRRIEEMLEDYLHGSLTAEREAEFRRALESADAETRQMVAAFSQHAQLIRQAFRAPEVAPAAGFYARVVERIDSQRVAVVSFWDAFLEPHFFKRLAFAALTLLMLLSVTMFTTPQVGLRLFFVRFASMPLGRWVTAMRLPDPRAEPRQIGSTARYGLPLMAALASQRTPPQW